MRTATFISIDEYLRTSYDPDCDYVDGRLEERNVGKRDHSAFQAEAAAYLIAGSALKADQYFVERDPALDVILAP